MIRQITFSTEGSPTARTSGNRCSKPHKRAAMRSMKRSCRVPADPDDDVGGEELDSVVELIEAERLWLMRVEATSLCVVLAMDHSDHYGSDSTY